ncbi:protein phosphatase 2C domain-containing protein [Nocardioides alpinus]|uniref:PPM-type phosphatase domain-containing protein n=1 Tax=Nocardioides alpinus TaxID=748909 RepID=A0ABX4QVG2_9ACTN|nr:protein phosphatase 2C domain-containing protein [Nocardioides alpinus]PKH40156.1 hypothetical protein CXG46_13440 [Nocardioides alpinus]
MGFGGPVSTTRPDIALTECEFDGRVVIGVSCRGLLHIGHDVVRQDSFGILALSDGRLAVIVCDGVGSRPDSHHIADAAVEAASAALSEGVSPDAAARRVNNSLLALRYRWDGATTFTLVVLGSGESSGDVEVVWVGDSPLMTLYAGEWFNRTDDAFTTRDQDDPDVSKTKALPSQDPSIQSSAFRLRPEESVFVMSDGVSKPLLGAADVRRQLALWWSNETDIYTFASQVEFGRKTHVDDRTVVAIWPSASLETTIPRADQELTELDLRVEYGEGESAGDSSERLACATPDTDAEGDLARASAQS